MDNLSSSSNNTSSYFPPPVQITKVDKYSAKDDPPMVDLKITNPVTYFKKWVGKFLSNQDIDLRLKIKPFATIGLILAFATVGTTTFSMGRYLFPNSSPILHRSITLQGKVQKSETGQYYLTLVDNSLWNLKSTNKVNFTNVLNKQVTVKGNLTAQANVIEVSEVIPFEFFTQTASTAINTPQLSNVTDRSIDEVIDLPALYSGLKWEITQKKTLIFTSGKRKIEQEGVYLESSQINSFPQEFVNYYIQQLRDRKFKETLNAIDPEGITITYAKDDLFLTFGIKNKYSGSGEKKQLTGYTAFLEHN